jgi:hypothetical protein
MLVPGENGAAGSTLPSIPQRNNIYLEKGGDDMAKKLAVLVRDRQAEALRMGVGLMLADDEVNVFVLDREVEKTDENELNVETMGDMDIKLFTNYKGNENMEYLSTEEIAQKLLECDEILPY